MCEVDYHLFKTLNKTEGFHTVKKIPLIFLTLRKQSIFTAFLRPYRFSSANNKQNALWVLDLHRLELTSRIFSDNNIKYTVMYIYVYKYKTSTILLNSLVFSSR